MREVVLGIIRHIVDWDFREWRYSATRTTQLGCLCEKSSEEWKESGKVSLRVPLPPERGGGDLVTRKEDGLGLLWATKIGGPSHGFDLGTNFILPLLTNGRSKQLMVNDPHWPYNSGARCRMSVLERVREGGEEGVIFLDGMQRDFPHRDAFPQNGEDEIHACPPPSCPRKGEKDGGGDEGGCHERRFRNSAWRRDISFASPSAGTFEASDTLGPHDWVQRTNHLSPVLSRFLFLPH